MKTGNWKLSAPNRSSNVKGDKGKRIFIPLNQLGHIRKDLNIFFFLKVPDLFL